MRARAAAAALIEQHDAKARRVEETPVGLGAPGTRTAVEEDDRDAIGHAALLVVESVELGNLELAGGVRFGRRQEMFVGHGGDILRWDGA